MKPIEGWDAAPAYTGEFRTLPKDKYKCKIMQVVEKGHMNDRGGRQVVIYFDIAEGEYKNYYQDLYMQAKKKDPNIGMEKWQGRYYQGNIDTTGLSWFKGIITSVEKSNPGFKWTWNENELKGKVFGGLFNYEEYIGNDGKKHRATKLAQIRSLEGLKDAVLPEDSLLPDPPAPAQGFTTQGASQDIPYIGRPGPDGFMNIPEGIKDEELPFN